ncbi:site-specific DNA-methyltransferase [uncultured Thiodictyon sp.]|uniref:site-specific DNA-methyltransferase n=1 Tax=uncultured Thiodictyon sp. TaxID=1846217 RepID=UPI0025EBD310|nr:site-specific DNA-methyltransferase [uncultured Thiodictyon sp.]
MTQAHGLPTLPTPRTQAETRFIALMAELFQLDEAQSLDFGLYRIIRRHNREVRGFLGELGPGPDGPALHGGRLCELLDDAFAAAGHEAQAQEEDRLKGLGQDLGLTPGMTRQQRDAALNQLGLTPLLKPQVAQYRALAEARAGHQTGESDRAEVLNRLYQFFSRHYQDGDFIVERRYGKGGARYLRSTGEDTEFHWATQDMYYIKSGDSFSDFPVRLGNGRRLCFTVDPVGLQATRATLKPGDKAHYALAAISAQGEVIRVALHYRKGAQNDKQREEIVAAILAAGAGGGATTSTEIRRWLNRFIARNQSDFFIHKRLGEALTEDLDLFIKTEVLDLDQLLADAAAPSLPGRALKVGRILRTVGAQIIAFLAALENFQKALWEKKKLVLSTRYVITLDRLERHAPAWLAGHIDAIIAGQRAEWTALGLGDYPDANACRRTTPGDLLTATATRYLPLPVDTGRFPDAFKWSLLEAVTAATPLDQALDGLAIHSDNWQALNLLHEKYRERIKLIYIDPPYNTGGDGFAYKDSYQSASWLAMIEDRLRLGAETLKPAGVLFSSIDQNEYPRLRTLLEQTLGSGNALGTIVWKNVTDNNPTNIAVEHEYVECFAKNRGTLESEWKNPYSDAKELLVKLGRDLLERHGDTAALRSAYQQWFKGNKVFLGPLDRYKYIDAGGVYTGSQSVHNPGREGYRYDVLHPRTKKPCKQPLMGYRFPEETLKRLLAEDRILFGEDETKLIELKVYAHEYEAKLPSVIEIDGRSGANDLTNLFGEAQRFKNPKAPALLQELIPYAAGAGDLVLDYFAGSGTTAHAVMRLNHKAGIGFKWLAVEASHNLEAMIVPRVKKVAFAVDWLKGRPIGNAGPGAFVRVQSFEQYDDSLESLDTEQTAGDTADLPFDDPALALRYRLDRASRGLYCAIERFGSPFGYQLRRADGGGAAQPCEVDLVESLAYLLGLDIARLYREPLGVVLLGSNRRGQTVGVFFRECAAAGSADWVAAKLAQHPAERVYTNDPAALSFAGCERLEAIEAAFALQFGRA